MKNTLLIICTFIMLQLQAQTTFQKTYSGSGIYESCNDVVITSGGDYLVAGEKYLGGGNFTGTLMQINPLGNVIWQKDYDGISIIKTIEPTADGGYILSGTSSSAGAGGIDMCLVKTDASGNPQWTKFYGTGYDEYVSDAIQTDDGGYILTGCFQIQMVNDTSSSYIIKTDSTGNLIWDKIIQYATFYEGANHATQTSDGGILVTGVHTVNQASRMLLMKIDSSGNTRWSRSYGNQFSGRLSLQTSDGGFITSGIGNSSSVNPGFLLCKSDSAGNIQWSKVFSNCPVAPDLIITSDGGYALAGTYQSAGDSASIFLIKTDALGDTTWTRIYSKPDTLDSKGEIANSLLQTPDGGYLVGGRYDRQSSADLYLLKTDANGDAVCNRVYRPINIDIPLMPFDTGIAEASGIIVTPFTPIIISGIVADSTFCLFDAVEEYNRNSEIQLYPNPAIEEIIISANFSDASPLLLIINDIEGREMLRKMILPFQKTLLNIKDFSAGIYFIMVSGNQSMGARKFVKQ